MWSRMREMQGNYVKNADESSKGKHKHNKSNCNCITNGTAPANIFTIIAWWGSFIRNSIEPLNWIHTQYYPKNAESSLSNINPVLAHLPLLLTCKTADKRLTKFGDYIRMKSFSVNARVRSRKCSVSDRKSIAVFGGIGNLAIL